MITPGIDQVAYGGMTVADDGTVFIAEGGTVWPTRPWMPSRLLRMDTDGSVRVIAREAEGGLRGIAWRDGYVYATVKGGVVQYGCMAVQTRWHRAGVDGLGLSQSVWHGDQ